MIIWQIEGGNPFPIYPQSGKLISAGLFQQENGIVKEGQAQSYHYLSRFNPEWRAIEQHQFAEVKINPNEEVGLAFTNQLTEQVGYIDGATFTFTYLSRTFTAEVSDFKLAVLDENAPEEVRSVLERFYPGVGSDATLAIQYRQRQGAILYYRKGGFCVEFIWFFVVNILLAAWVAEDAKKRGNSGAWGLLVFFTSILGLIIYFVVREGFQRDELELPPTIKGIVALCIVSLLANGFLFNRLTNTKSQGSQLARTLVYNQAQALSFMASSLNWALENPDDQEILGRISALSLTSSSLLSTNSGSVFVDEKLNNELLILAYYAGGIADMFLHEGGIAAISEEQSEEIAVFIDNLRTAADEIRFMEMRGMDRGEALNTLQSINEANRTLKIFSGTEFVPSDV